jgi:hypothetical protein
MLRRRGIKIFLSLILIGLIIISGIYGLIIRGNDDANSNIVNNRVSASKVQNVKEEIMPAVGRSYRISPSSFNVGSNLPILTGADA